jgi:hypothetical protein
MEIKILDSIMHGVLKPWNLDAGNTRRFTELVKAAKAVSPRTNGELHSQLTTLLTDYLTLQKMLSDEATASTPLHQLLYTTDLPKYKDAVTHFYYLIIAGETIRLFNAVLQQAANWTELVDVRYQVGKTLTNVRVLAKQATVELNERGFSTIPDAQSEIVHFALYYLKHSLIQLYFSIQEQFKESLLQTITIEDFYLLDLEEPIANIVYPVFVGEANSKNQEQNTTNTVQDKLSFGFTGDKDRLKAVIVQLCQKIELLNEDQTSSDTLLKIFTSRDLEAISDKVYLGCETTQFRYIIDKLTPHFTNLKLKNIEKTAVFFSKNGTKITAQNLSAGKVDNPKEKRTIDSILKQLQ